MSDDLPHAQHRPPWTAWMTDPSRPRPGNIVTPGSNGWLKQVKQQYDEHGFFILPGLLDERQVESMHGSVTEWLNQTTKRGGRGEKVWAMENAYGIRHGGWVVHDFAAEPKLQHLQTELEARAMLRDALEELFGGPSKYRILTRKDVYIDYSTSFHRDALWGPFTQYADGLGLPLCAEARLPDGDRPHIATVAVYMQDHYNETAHTGLWVHPGTHVTLSDWQDKLARGDAHSEMPVHTRRGDVVVFDTLLFHSGRRTPYNRHHSLTASHRHLYTMQYGAWPSVFSESQARGFAARDQIFNNRTQCPHAHPTKECALKLALADLQANPLSVGNYSTRMKGLNELRQHSAVAQGYKKFINGTLGFDEVPHGR